MKKVLLIEDDTILRENTAELLELAGYDVSTAPNGKKGVEAATTILPDVIVCDIMMPEMDGYGVLATLSKQDDTKAIPFIFLSAKTERRDIRKGMELGADDYLTKPFEEDELMGAIESRLARRAILEEMGRGGGDPKGEYLPKNLHQMKNFMDDHGEEKSVAAGENLYREGAQSNTVYLVLNGVIKTHILDEKGKELITGVYHPDDFFGLSSFTDNKAYSETATAMEAATVVGVSKDLLRKIIAETPELALELMQFLSDNLTDVRDQLLQMAYGTVRQKTASTLLKFADRLPGGADGDIHVLRSDLAGVAGIAVETLIRTLGQFRDEGLIRIENRNIRLLDIPALRKI